MFGDQHSVKACPKYVKQSRPCFSNLLVKLQERRSGGRGGGGVE